MTDTGTTANTASSKANEDPRKRKAEELSDDSVRRPAALHLPAPVWGHQTHVPVLQ